MATGEGFATGLGNIGSGIGGFIGGITTPIFGGTTEQSVTTEPVKNSGAYTPMIIGIVAIVLVLAIIGYFIFRR